MTSFNLSEWALRHRPFVWFLIIVLIFSGTLAYTKLGRTEDPTFTLKTMVVQADWPGASIDDTILQVTDRLERKLQETPNIDYVRSLTIPGRTTIFVNLKDDTRASEVPNIWYQVRKKVADIQGTLPQGVIGPSFDDEFGDTYGIIYAFTADGFTHRELRDYVEDIRSRLLRVPDVSKIEVIGAQDERIYLEFSVEVLAGLGIDRDALRQVLVTQNAITPAGTIQTRDEKIMVRVGGVFQSEEDLARINFVSNGRLLRLTDIATVRRAYADPPQPQFRVNGEPAIGLAVAMRDGGDVLALGRNISRAMAQITAGLPIGIEPQMVANQPEIVKTAIDDFTEALLEAIAIVLVVSLLSLGLRAGAVVAVTIPLVLAVVFVSMSIFGIDLQRVSLGALIIALGLLVDDAMITVETMVKRLEHGDDKIGAATFAYTSTAFPMLTGTLVTVIGFVPVGFARSSASEYTFSLFAVVAIALAASWFAAVIFAPLIGVTLLSASPHSPRLATSRLESGFRRILLVAMRARWITLAGTFALFVLAIVGMAWVPQQFFPASDRSELIVDLKLPENDSINATGAATSKLDTLLKGDPDISHWSGYVGRGAVRFYQPLNVQLPNDWFSQTVIVTKSLEARELVRKRLEESLPSLLPSVVTHVYPLELGPPIGWPLQYRITGPDPKELRRLAYQLADLIGEQPAATNISFDWIETGETLRLDVNQVQARILGVRSDVLAQTLNGTLSGVTVTQIRDGIYLIDVVVRATERDRLSLSTLRTLQIPASGGRTVPLAEVASLGYGQELPAIWRRDRHPSLTVQADVVQGFLPETIVKSMATKVAELNATLKPGYSIVVGGGIEASQTSQVALIKVLPIVALLTLTVLMIQLGSFQRLFLVLSLAPLGLIGVVGALLLSGQALGFVAVLGILALIGMIIRNAVILVHQIEHEIASGRDRWDAVVEATTHRLRPILLTAAAAILGMIPIAPTVFWGPMATAIMGGLAVATLLTLIFLPALYVTWFRVKAPSHPV